MKQSTSVFESTTCGRCGGSGKYSFNLMHGTRCFGCSGRGWKQTKRGAAAQQYFNALVSKTAPELVPGDKIFYQGFAAGSYVQPSAWHMVTSVTIDGDKAIIDTNGCNYHTTTKELFRVAQTKEQKATKIQQALEYQATLTKSGKPAAKKAA